MLNKEEREGLCMDYSRWIEKWHASSIHEDYVTALCMQDKADALSEALGHLGYEFVEKYNHGNGIIDFDLVKRTDE